MPASPRRSWSSASSSSRARRATTSGARISSSVSGNGSRRPARRSRARCAAWAPETVAGDGAGAGNPGRARFPQLIGKRVQLPLTGRTIPVIADEYVDPQFGTGAVKITPGHDFNDYQVGKRHALEAISVFTL